MEKHVVMICLVAGFFGLLAVILGFVAEATKPKSFVGYDGMNCVYRNTPALGRGIMGAMSLLMGQIIIAVATGCCGCCRNSPTSKTKHVIAILLGVISWILVVVAVSTFFAGAGWNTAGERKPVNPKSGECYVLHGGVFAMASVLSLIVVVFGITSYILLETPAGSPEPPVISMGLPPYFQPEQGHAWHGDQATAKI